LTEWRDSIGLFGPTGDECQVNSMQHDRIYHNA